MFPKLQRLFSGMAAALVAAMPVLVYAQTAVKPAQEDESKLPATIRAEQMTGRPDREVTLERNVEITRGNTVINADRATYDIVEDQVEAAGNIRMQRFGDRYTGEELKLKLDVGRGYVTQPTYRLEHNNAQGQARRINFESEDQAVVTDGTYSTCEGPDPDWYLKSDVLHLDRGRDVGTAAKTVVYFKGVPILGTPAMSFPLSDARKSGVLPPTIGTSSGLEVTVPYYFNIAPNRDLTLYPSILTRHGFQLGMDGRYLSEKYFGETWLEVVPSDLATKTNRYAVTSIHTQSLAPGWGMSWNLNAASDDNYPNDFPRTITTSSQRLLSRDLNLNYSAKYWNFGARASNYQVLQDPASPIPRPYDRLPQLTFQAGRLDMNGFDWSADSELTRFWHPDAGMLRGDRFVANPKISYPIIRPGYFVTPKLSFDLTKYSLDNPVAGAPSSLTRTLPTFSLDSGLAFERNARFFGQDMTQTLEPRLFYVRTPYRDQSLYPNFDTAEADLSFAQLFSENRFVGHDRIGDANQLTAALVSRYIEPSGAERLRVAVGQRFYFSRPRVTLGAPSDENRSDLLLSAFAQLSAKLSTEVNMQYGDNQNVLNRANFSVRWQPGPKRVLNLQYRRDVLNNLEQMDGSAQWPIARRWYAVARVNYSLPDQKVAEGLLGMEYKADCWVFRIVAQRIPTATGKAASPIFFQLELNGLTRLGSNPLPALRASVRGYQLVNQPEAP
ncbi:MAG TPA: LPS-assembly protein LptD [Burkholderiaceae bacterium]|nr:LPS-assembly protein LptD [Burkholderiaceae bacterium]